MSTTTGRTRRSGRVLDGEPGSTARLSVRHHRAMAALHPLPDEIVELLARRFRVLGDPTRIRLLERLQAGEATVQELCEVAGCSQQNVSKHLGVLTDAGITARRREGSHAVYRVIDDGVYRLCEDVCGSLQRQLESLGDVLRGAAR